MESYERFIVLHLSPLNRLLDSLFLTVNDNGPNYSHLCLKNRQLGKELRKGLLMTATKLVDTADAIYMSF